MSNGYDQSVAPKEGKSAISAKTRKRIYSGGKKNKPAAKTETENFQPDMSNQFAGNVDMSLQDELQDLMGLWGGGAPQQTSAPAPAGNSAAQDEFLRGLLDLWSRPENAKIRPREAFMAEREARDPVGYANTERQMPGFEWNDPRGAFYNRPRLSPEAILASQGNNATNQWAQRGAVEGIDPEELARLNQQARISRQRSFV